MRARRFDEALVSGGLDGEALPRAPAEERALPTRPGAEPEEALLDPEAREIEALADAIADQLTR